MKRQAGHIWVLLLLFLVPRLVLAGEEGASRLPPREIDRLLAQVALYPDTLLAQVLTAVTHPEDLAAAAAWLETKRGMQGERTLQAALAMPWDASVASLTPFPGLIRRLHREAEWASRTAAVFLGAESDVLDSIQRLRRLAIGSGALPEHLRAERQGREVRIEAMDSSRLSVPYYDPAEAYGPWPWPGYPPVRWSSTPGERYRATFIRLTPGLLYAGFDWPGRQTHIVSLRLEPGLLAVAPESPPEPQAKPAQAPAIPRVPNTHTVAPVPLVQLGVAPEPSTPSVSGLFLGANPTAPPAVHPPAMHPPKIPSLVALGRPNPAPIVVPRLKASPEPEKAEIVLAEPAFGSTARTAVPEPPVTESALPVIPAPAVAQRRAQTAVSAAARMVKPFHAFISEADRRTLEALK